MINVGLVINLYFVCIFVMGVVNVIFNLFFDGGMWVDFEVVICYVCDFVVEGVDIIDVGGELICLGIECIFEYEELCCVLFVVKVLVVDGVVVFVDIMCVLVVKVVVEVGVIIVNDVFGGKVELEIFDVVVDVGVDYVFMYWCG